uniref:Uncharacterized protein n=1 Tax=Haptolina ericina TaxID=156174 RepID=A0A7S3FHM6_9EUKA|mmetsp:Transcript_71755/g.159564  ORF Transcript_71755/g.159564 Transcript_71755/m.159564 type:complete len:299 (+) Transcript_71755:123-1019(+)
MQNASSTTPVRPFSTGAWGRGGQVDNDRFDGLMAADNSITGKRAALHARQLGSFAMQPKMAKVSELHRQSVLERAARWGVISPARHVVRSSARPVAPREGSHALEKYSESTQPHAKLRGGVPSRKHRTSSKEKHPHSKLRGHMHSGKNGTSAKDYWPDLDYCWLLRENTNLANLERFLTLCETRRKTLKAAQTACIKMDGCGGVVRDTGIRCMGATMRYSLRSSNMSRHSGIVSWTVSPRLDGGKCQDVVMSERIQYLVAFDYAESRKPVPEDLMKKYIKEASNSDARAELREALMLR